MIAMTMWMLSATVLYSAVFVVTLHASSYLAIGMTALSD